MDEQAVENFVSSVIRKVSGEMIKDSQITDTSMSEDNKGDLHKEEEHVAVFNTFDDSRRGKKAPRYLLAQPPDKKNEEVNINNHHHDINGFRSMKQDSTTDSTVHDAATLRQDTEDNQDIIKFDSHLDSFLSPQSDSENDYISLRDENETLRRQMLTMKKNHHNEIANMREEVRVMQEVHAQDMRDAYMNGMKFAKNGDRSQLHDKIDRLNTIIKEQAADINTLRFQRQIYEQDANAVNQHLLLEVEQMKGTYMDLVHDNAAAGVPLSADTQHLLFKTQAAHTKALATCVDLQAIINEQRLKLWAFQNHFVSMYYIQQENQNQALDTVKGSTGDGATEGAVGDQPPRQPNMILSRPHLLQPNAMHHKDPLSMIIENFEIGCDIDGSSWEKVDADNVDM